MINLCIVDYYSHFKTNGLNSYLNQLIPFFKKNRYLQIHHIWVNSFIDHKSYAKKTDKAGNIHLYLPNDIAVLTDSSANDVQGTEFITGELAGKENILIHFNWINHCAFAHLLQKKLKCKTLLTKHCIPWREMIVGNYESFYKLNQTITKNITESNCHPLLINELFAYQSVNHIIGVTGYAKHALVKMFSLAENKISVIHNGFESSLRIERSKAALRKKYGFDSKEKIILFAGKINRPKGAFDLVKSFEKVIENSKNNNVRLVLAGEGNVFQLLSGLEKNWSKITVTGYLNKKTLYDFYRMADVGVVPSYVEQCSYTAIEMMYHGLPIIATNVDGLKEIIPDDCGLKVELLLGKKEAQVDQVDLAKKILFFIKNPAIARKFGLQARKHAIKNLASKKMAVETIQVYEKLIAEPDDQKLSNNEVSPSSAWPLVSILLPCHNAEKYLQECLDSIFQQTYTNFELIIVNDDSTDNTKDLITKNNDPRIVYIENPANEGIVFSLNKAIEKAKGKYIARIDADDLMQKERLLKQVQFLENQENIDVAMIGSGHFVINNMGKPLGLKTYPLTNEEIKICLLFRNPFSHPSIMIRAAVMKSYLYSQKYKHNEDYELWFKVAADHKVANIPEYGTYYRIHQNNISIANSKKQQENTLELLSDQLDKLGIEHSAQDLAIHAAINLGYGVRYFNSPEKKQLLKNWLNKLLNQQKLKHNFSTTFISKMHIYITETYCK